MNQHVHAYLPGPILEPELHHLVKMYQTHAHSKTCRKYKNFVCRFNFGHFFTDRTTVATPLPNHLSDKEKSDRLASRKNILTKVKTVINETLNPSKRETYDPSSKIVEILHAVDMAENDYYEVLSTAGGTDFGLHLKRPPNSCFNNNYNPFIDLKSLASKYGSPASF